MSSRTASQRRTIGDRRGARNGRAILLMILSVAMLALVDGIAKAVAAEGLHPFMIAFFRNLFGMMAMAPFFLRTGLAGLKTTRLGMHLGRGAVHAVSMLCWFTALTLVPLAEATAMSFSSPVFASIGAVLILGERSRPIRWASVAIGFAGMLIILRPGIQDWNLGATLLIIGAVCIAAVKLMVKSLSRTDTPATIVGIMSITLTIYTLVPALFVWQWPSAGMLLMLAAMGALGTAAHVVQTLFLPGRRDHPGRAVRLFAPGLGGGGGLHPVRRGARGLDLGRRRRHYLRRHAVAARRNPSRPRGPRRNLGLSIPPRPYVEGRP
jgi:drug/metabolite transporter (DMT)-like permease